MGIRLKGNSTLSSLRGDRGGAGGGRMPAGAGQDAPPQQQGGGARTAARPRPAAVLALRAVRAPKAPLATQAAGRPQVQRTPQAVRIVQAGRGGMTQFNLSAGKPEELPSSSRSTNT
ncbi:hypothetical protein NKH18_10370 [Streptomyces sp. M10(2022)]